MTLMSISSIALSITTIKVLVTIATMIPPGVTQAVFRRTGGGKSSRGKSHAEKSGPDRKQTTGYPLRDLRQSNHI